MISSKMDQTAASVVAQAEQLELQMEGSKAVETRLSRLEALGATNETAGCWCITADYPPGHALPASIHISGPTRFYLWMGTVSPCGVLPV